MNYIEIELKFQELQPWQEIATALLANMEFESFINTESGLKAYIPLNLYESLDSIELYLRSGLNTEFEIKEKEFEDQNWNATWEENFEPIYIGNEMEIIAPFHEKGNLKYSVLINPQMSFGTGHHETTRLISSYLLDMDLQGKTLLDMGTGTGVLAILAELKGANSILGVDIEDWAYHNALDNIQLNNCKEIQILKGDVDIVPVKEYDVLIANINKNVLLNHLPHYQELLKKGGTLFLSGFFHSDVQDLVTKSNSCGFILEKEINENSWSALKLIKE